MKIIEEGVFWSIKFVDSDRQIKHISWETLELAYLFIESSKLEDYVISIRKIVKERIIEDET